MGSLFLKDKPVANSFSHAYVEDANGALVRIPIEDMKALLGLAFTDIEITLLANSWVASDDASYFTQELTIEDSTAKTKVDLQATAAQIIQLMNEELSMFVANDEGVIKVYSVNGAPSSDMTFKARVTEVL